MIIPGRVFHGEARDPSELFVNGNGHSARKVNMHLKWHEDLKKPRHSQLNGAAFVF